MGEGEITHLTRQPVDYDLALRQWNNYVQAFVDNGWTVHEVDPAPEYPDSVFVEDTMVVYDDIAIIAHSGAKSRVGEPAAAEEMVKGFGYKIHHINAPGTMDGGDVMKYGKTMWVGQTDRSNAEALAQMQAILQPKGVKVVGVNHHNVLHLKSGVTMLPDGTALGYAPLVKDWAIWDNILFVPEFSGSHVVSLEDNRILMSADAPQSAEIFRQRGYDVTEVDISEFIKMEGCVTCLSVRMRGVPGLE